jgi:hypothetical protein
LLLNGRDMKPHGSELQPEYSTDFSFSCKGRGVCPSCNGRHMAQTAAHLADHVIPPVPVRQWVISVPKRLRGMLADRPTAVAALTKIFLDEIERTLCAVAGGTRDADATARPRPRLGGISFLHRFGSALNHHVHLHACVTDGVFLPAAHHAGCDAPPTFVPAPPITPADLTPSGQKGTGTVCWRKRSQSLPPPTCSPGRTVGSPSTRVFESRSSTATCPAISRLSNTC